MHNAEDNDQRDDFDDFRVGITDLPPEETPGISSVLLDLDYVFSPGFALLTSKYRGKPGMMTRMRTMTMAMTVPSICE